MSEPPSTVFSHGFRQFSVSGRPFPIFGGTVGDSTASDPALLESKVWPAARALHLNTVFAPVSWQLLEPEEGKFDFSVPDAIFRGARENGLKLAVIWYGAWKNGTSCYAPDWVKLDWDRFPLARPLLGRRTELLSPCSPEMLGAEKAAFSALMRHLKKMEEAEGGAEPTVIMVQIEEGIGMVGGSRDASGDSDSRWSAGVPDALISGLKARAGRLHPEIAKALGRVGSWPEVFGPNAEGAFMAWQFAKHVETLANAGSLELPVPYFVSAWSLATSSARNTGEKPGGAPDGEMADVWDIAAPAVLRALPSPTAQSLLFLHPSAGEDSTPALFPRVDPQPDFAAKLMVLFGGALASGVSIAGIESFSDNGGESLAARAIGAMSALSAKLGDIRAESTVRGLMQQARGSSTVSLGDYSFTLEWTRPARGLETPGGCFAAIGGDGAFWIAGLGAKLVPRHDRAGYVTSILSQEEFLLRDGSLVRGRILNGTDRDILLPEGEISIRRFRLYRRPI